MSGDSNQFRRQLFLIFTVWLIYFVIYKIALLRFPHWELSIFSHINNDLFFLILLLSYAVFAGEKHYPYVFLNLAILSSIYITGHVLIFIGKGYTIGDDRLLYIVWSYRKILISVAICVTVIYMVMEILLKNKNFILKYLVSFACIIPIFLLNYHKFIIDWKTVFMNNSQYHLLSSAIGMNFWAIFFIGILGYVNYKRKLPLQKHISLLAVCLFIFLLVDSWDNYYNFQHKELPEASQIFLFLNLIFFCVILIDKLGYMHSDFGEFYDNYLTSKIKLKLRIIPKKSRTEKYIQKFYQYLKVLPNRFFFIILMIVSITMFLYFFPYNYLKVNILLIIGIIMVLMLYLIIVFNKRSKNN